MRSAHSGWYAHRLHQENFNETPNQLGQFSLESPTGAWLVGTSLPRTLQKVHIEGSYKEVPKQKSLNMVQDIKKEPAEDPSELLERIS